MIELGVLAMLIIVMVGAIYLCTNASRLDARSFGRLQQCAAICHLLRYHCIRVSVIEVLVLMSVKVTLFGPLKT